MYQVPYYFGLVLILLVSCGSAQHTTILNKTIEDTFSMRNPYVRDSLHKECVIWSAEADASAVGVSAVRVRDVNSDTLTPEKLIAVLNRQWPLVTIADYKIMHDTIHVHIPYSLVLTQQMGSTGALEYAIVTTYTLTEMKGVKYVYMDFEEGDHLVPGIFTRERFK